MPDYSYAKKIIEAAERGETIERYDGFDGTWMSLKAFDAHAVWALNDNTMFRIKPQPKLRPYTYETFPGSAARLEIDGSRACEILERDRFGFRISGAHWRFESLLDVGNSGCRLLDYAGKELDKGVPCD